MHRFSQHQIQDHLKDEVFHLISRTADLKGFECYVVGGYVRDILLGRPTCDIDVVVVGNGIEMALLKGYGCQFVTTLECRCFNCCYTGWDFDRGQ